MAKPMRQQWCGSRLVLLVAASCSAFQGLAPRKTMARRSAKGLSAAPLSKELDTDAVARYGGAVAAQFTTIAALLGGVDAACAASNVELPPPVVAALFFGLSLKSRVFSPLDNSRPDLDKAVAGEKTRGFTDRTMPSWTPPGVTFPIMWVLVVAPLRAWSSMHVFEACGGGLLESPVLFLVLHLCVGDTWNTVNNVERRLGAAVPGVACVWLSVLLAASQYYAADATAGAALGLTAVWITIAGLLVADTWRVNNADGDEPLFPYKSDAAVTRFFFE